MSLPWPTAADIPMFESQCTNISYPVAIPVFHDCEPYFTMNHKICIVTLCISKSFWIPPLKNQFLGCCGLHLGVSQNRLTKQKYVSSLACSPISDHEVLTPINIAIWKSISDFHPSLGAGTSIQGAALLKPSMPWMMLSRIAAASSWVNLGVDGRSPYEGCCFLKVSPHQMMGWNWWNLIIGDCEEVTPMIYYIVS